MSGQPHEIKADFVAGAAAAGVRDPEAFCRSMPPEYFSLVNPAYFSQHELFLDYVRGDTGEGRVFNFQGDSEHFVLLPYGPPRATAQVGKTPRPLRKDDARRRTRPPVPSAPARKDPGRAGKDRTHPFC